MAATTKHILIDATFDVPAAGNKLKSLLRAMADVEVNLFYFNYNCYGDFYVFYD